jgi:glycosyltransferase involved in cell wall biosynthesis
MTARPRVQFVTYEASRTGSPLLLLRFLRWLRDEGSLELDVICWRGGPLMDAFAEIAPTKALAPLGRRTAVETLAVGAGEVGLAAAGRRVEAARLALALRGRPGADLLYLNGVPSFTALAHLDTGGAPILGHVHELEFALGRSLPADEAHLLDRADRYVAVSTAVADNLVANHGIDRTAVAVCHGFVDDQPAPNRGSVPNDASAELRRRLGIPPDAPVVGAMGDLIWRKGPDLFVHLAAAVTRSSPSEQPAPHFVWVGGAPADGRGDELTRDIAGLGLTGHVHLVGEQDRPGDWHRLFDVFALTSREDPFPLVVLEAAQHEVPVVAFRQGGAPELLTPEDAPADTAAGVVVGALDVAAMAEAVRGLLDDPDRARAMGRAGAGRVRDHHVTSVAAPKLYAQIQALL